MRIGIFGGSFNPVHLGHIKLAEGVVASGLVDEVWLVMSPLNPFKADSSELASDADRLAMLRLATENTSEAFRGRLKVSDIELSMPRPSYTINTLRKLSEEHPGDSFRLIIGADNWAKFSGWRAHEELLRDFHPIVYPRSGFPLPEKAPDGVDFLHLRLWNVSSTEIRRMIAEGTDPNNLLSPEVYNYIVSHNLYQK